LGAVLMNVQGDRLSVGARRYGHEHAYDGEPSSRWARRCRVLFTPPGRDPSRSLPKMAQRT
jgi:hypothetical protein